MSPEQCLGKASDRRSDIFALGIVMYELTTVSRLFKGENDYITMNRIATGDIPSPTKKRPDYPPALEAILMKALAALDPIDRYQTAGEMLRRSSSSRPASASRRPLLRSVASSASCSASGPNRGRT